MISLNSLSVLEFVRYVVVIEISSAATIRVATSLVTAKLLAFPWILIYDAQDFCATNQSHSIQLLEELQKVQKEEGWAEDVYKEKFILLPKNKRICCRS